MTELPCRMLELDAGHNELVALSDSLLGDQSELERVSFAHNQLQLVSSRDPIQ